MKCMTSRMDGWRKHAKLTPLTKDQCEKKKTPLQITYKCRRRVTSHRVRHHLHQLTVVKSLLRLTTIPLAMAHGVMKCMQLLASHTKSDASCKLHRSTHSSHCISHCISHWILQQTLTSVEQSQWHFSRGSFYSALLALVLAYLCSRFSWRIYWS